MRFELLAQGGVNSGTLSAALGAAVRAGDFDRLEVAVAYATKQGVRTLELALGGMPDFSFWVVGLDDAITQPEAIEYLIGLAGAHVRVVALAPRRRFHPKLYCISSTTNDSTGISVVGSGNMTLNGFRNNGETAVLAFADTAIDVEMLRNQWDQMWELGQPVTQVLIDEYRVRYLAARKARKTIAELGVAPAEPDALAPVRLDPKFDGDPINAVITWTEAGSPSAGGLDLEFPRELMPYFALQPGGGLRRFKTTDSIIHNLRFTYRPNNMMWRLLFTADSVESMIGRRSLRPAPGRRSEYAVVFERADGNADFELSAVEIGSIDSNSLVADSVSVGGLRATPGRGGRQFGFY